MILRSIDLASAQRYRTPHLQIRKLRRLCLVQATNLIDYLEVVTCKYAALFNCVFPKTHLKIIYFLKRLVLRSIDYLEVAVYKYAALFNHIFNFVIPDLIRDPEMTLARTIENK